MREKIHQLVIDLGLKGIQNVLDTELDAAEKKGTAIEKVLYRMLCEEFAFRQQRSMHNRIHHAKIPFDWTLKTFPFGKQPGVKKSQMMSLAGLDFIERDLSLTGAARSCGRRFPSPRTEAVFCRRRERCRQPR